MYLLNRLFEALLLPPFGPLLWIAGSLWLTRYRPRLGWGMAGFGLFAAWGLMTPAVVGCLLAPLEDLPVLRPDRLDGAGAIVILGGGRHSSALEYAGDTVNRLTLERLRYGARIARASGLPVLVSGGVAGRWRQRSEAQLMQEALTLDFGVKVRWLENKSVNTRENARYSAVILKQAGIDRVILVTHAAHMRRAMTYFEQAGIKVTPAPTSFQGGSTRGSGVVAWLPSQNSSYAGWYALHEWAGLLQQRLMLWSGSGSGY